MSCDFTALANPGVAGLSPYQAGKPIEEVQRELGLSEIIKLASNENPLGPSAAVVSAIQAGLKDLTRYPDANGFQLKQALSAHFGVMPSQITLGNGSNDVLDLLGRTFLTPGCSAVFSQYAFIVYPLTVKACGARAIEVPARQWGHDLDAMAAAIEADTRMLFLANPNNPTGTWFTAAELEQFMAKVPEHVVVVLDEAYLEYQVVDGLPDGAALVDRYPNLVVTRTFSKIYGLAALRVGFALASAEITGLLNRVRQPFNCNSLGLLAAVAALADEDYLTRSAELNRQGMEYLQAAFARLGIECIPSAGNFITFAVPDGDAQGLYQHLLQQGVIVRPIGVYGMPGHLRVSIGLEGENRRFVACLERCLGGVA